MRLSQVFWLLVSEYSKSKMIVVTQVICKAQKSRLQNQRFIFAQVYATVGEKFPVNYN